MSVVIPCYNSRAFINDALRSVERQTRQPMEIVVVDDGSRDGTVAEISSRKWKLPVRIFSLFKNRGPAYARDYGVKVAKGEWVAFLDADDLWRPDKLEKQLACLSPEVEFVYSDMSFISRRGRVLRKKALTHVQRNCIRRMRPVWGFPFYPMISTVLARRRLILEVGSFDRNLRRTADDFDLWLRIFLHAGVEKIRCLEDPLALYRVHAAPTGFRAHAGMPREKQGPRYWLKLSRKKGAELSAVERDVRLDFAYLGHKHRRILNRPSPVSLAKPYR